MNAAPTGQGARGTRMNRTARMALMAVLLAAACGQRGPLYLRDNPPPGVKVRKTDTYQPVPYPPEDAERASEKK